MIIDRLENLGNYVPLHPLFAEAFEYICRNDLQAAETGKTSIREGELNVIVEQTLPKIPGEAVLEAHRNYIDIQIPLSGTEKMGYAPLSDCKEEVSPYNMEKDLQFFTDPAQTLLTVAPGMFVIFFPQDAHAPGITPSGVKKAIIKVKA